MKIQPHLFKLSLFLVFPLICSCAKKNSPINVEVPIYTSQEIQADTENLALQRKEYINLDTDLQRKIELKRALSQNQLEQILSQNKIFQTSLNAYINKYERNYKINSADASPVIHHLSIDNIRNELGMVNGRTKWIEHFLNDSETRFALGYEIFSNARYYTSEAYLTRDKASEVFSLNSKSLFYNFTSTLPNIESIFSSIAFGENAILNGLKVQLSANSQDDDVILLTLNGKLMHDADEKIKNVSLIGLEQSLVNKIQENFPETRDMYMFISESYFNRYRNESLNKNQQNSYYIVVSTEPKVGGNSQHGYIFTLESLVVENKKDFKKSAIKIMYPLHTDDASTVSNRP
jgi:hypothetical protein